VEFLVRRSSVVLSDDEIAAQIRAEHEGHPEEWVAEKVEEALATRRANAGQLQHDYDTKPPHRPYASTQD
jgi:hypothetical protein